MPRPRQAKSPKKGRVAFKKDGREIKQVIRSKWYPFHIQKVKRGINNKCKLRKGLQPGTVVVLLTGPYRGRRVVFLKQLEHSGHLLVTGPFQINHVPLRKVSQRFVLITTTKIDVGQIEGLENIKEDYFKAPKKNEKFPEEKKKVQTNIDDQVMASVKKAEYMYEYLRSYFTIVPGQPPHAVKL